MKRKKYNTPKASVWNIGIERMICDSAQIKVSTSYADQEEEML